MLSIGITDILTLFLALGVTLIFILVWIIKSESKRDIIRNEIKRLRSQLEATEREKFLLVEKLDNLENLAKEVPQNADSEELKIAQEQNEELKKENERLSTELKATKSSMEEIYQALVEKKQKKAKQ